MSIHGGLPPASADGVGQCAGTRASAVSNYRVTDAGRRALRDGLEQPIPGVDKDFLQLKTWLGEHMRHEKLVEEIERNREHHRRHLAWLEELQPRVDPEEEFFATLTILHGIEATGARIRWCDQALELLAARKAT